MQTITYKLYRNTFPKKRVEDCIIWAIRKWEKELDNAVRFVEVEEWFNWSFCFKQHPKYPEKIARCDLHEPHRATIYFDLRQKWALNFFQRALGLGEDLRATALHEIGHALGLDHINVATSIMNSQITTNRIDDVSALRARAYAKNTDW